MHGHGAHDDMSYVPEEMLEKWSRRDPIELYERRLAEEHGFEKSEIDQIRESVATYVDECAERAVASPMPDPQIATEGVFADSWAPLGDGQAPWSRWSQADQGAAGSGNGHPPSNGRQKTAVEHGRAA
jgi:TPP-dependent pyruvate/acetoin dehydrogenase alpha subunit